jgi:NAD(P)-dependent dehydrogenase (short-subunit alcohol dehydrogenase family)
MEGKHMILVTGTSSGLGQATANSLLNQNFSVIGIDVQSGIIEHQNYTHLTMDLATFEFNQIQEMVENQNWFGFIHCAAVSQGSKLDSLSIEDWNHSMDVNVTSAMLICQLADSQMMDGGRIVLVGSPVAFAGANKPSYAASKAALHGLTMSVSRQLGKRGICVNTVLPGPMITGMTKDWSEEKRNRIAEETRLNRLARPEDIAHVIAQMMGENWSYMSASVVDLTCGSMYGH